MLVIAGLGNPGPEYAGHRHNVGFMAVDAIHRRHGFAPWRRRFHGDVAEGNLSGNKVLLLKPLTYMNESGRAVGEAMRFYKLAPSDVLVIHDEVDLPPGKFRMKAGGGTAGHNGLRSIGATLGDGFRRMRIGVGHPGVKEMVPHHVLRDFSKADRKWLEPLIDAIADNAPLLAEGKDPTFANRIHEATGGEEKKPRARPAEAGGAAPAKAETAKPPLEEPDAVRDAARGESGGPLARGLRRLFGS